LQAESPTTHPIDHVIAVQHGGRSVPEYLALACLECNSHKGPNVAGFDPETDLLVRLFHLHVDDWEQHFHWDGPILVGLTDIGCTTIRVLAINRSERVLHRELLIEEGVFPPE